jgi:hypothetical protein
MKTFSTLFISIFSFATVSATEISSNLEITNTAVVPATSLTTGGKGNGVILNWSAKNETNNTRYEVERSFYSNNFTAISTMQIPFVINNSNNYSINDNAAELAGRVVVYYRVKQIAANGSITYSNTMVVNLKGANTNAVTTNNSIHFTATQNGTAIIKIKSITGQTAATINSIITRGDNTVELNNTGKLAKGIYVTEVIVNGIVVDNQKVIVE